MSNVVDLGAYREAKRSVDREEVLDRLLELKNQERLDKLNNMIDNYNRSESIEDRIKKFKEAIDKINVMQEEFRKGK